MWPDELAAILCTPLPGYQTIMAFADTHITEDCQAPTPWLSADDLASSAALYWTHVQ